MKTTTSICRGRACFPLLVVLLASHWVGYPLASRAQNRDFESGTLSGWTMTGSAFANQPTYDDNIAARSPGIVVNQQGHYWIGTYENRHSPSDPAGGIQGDAPVGTLTSDTFVASSGFLSFLLGGGTRAASETARLRVELLIQGDPPDDLSLLLRLLGLGARVDLPDGRYFIGNYAIPGYGEEMRGQTFDCRPYAGKTARIRIVDDSSAPGGHINCDNFQFSGGIAGDIRITGIDVTQAIQTYPDMTIPLMNGKPTLVRVYVQSAPDFRGPWRNVGARLTVRTGTTTRTHEPIPESAAITVDDMGSRRDTLRDSFNFLLNYDETLRSFCDLEARIFPIVPQPETDLVNNWMSQRVTFIPSSSLSVYRVTYANRSSGIACRSVPDGYRPPVSNFEVHRIYTQTVFPITHLDLMPFPGDPILDFDNSTCDAVSASDRWLGNTLDRLSPRGGRRALILQPEGDCACGIWYMTGAGNHGVRSQDLRDPQGTFAQELAHSFGRPHSWCGVTPDNWRDPDFPWHDGSLGPDVGIRFSPTLVTMPGAENPTVSDFMGYCTPDWVSAYTYCKLLSEVRGLNCGSAPSASPIALSESGPVAWNSEPGLLSPSSVNGARISAPEAASLSNKVFLYVSGTLTPSNALFDPFEMISSAEDITTTNQGASYELVFEDKSHNPLQVRWLDPGQTSHQDPDAEPRFSLFVPWLANTTRIKLLDGLTAMVLAQRDVSAHAPQLTLLSPAGGEIWSGRHTVTWQANDADNDPLTYSVYYSADGGTRWLPVGVGLSTSSLEVDFDSLAGSDRALIRVAASDAINTTTAEPNGFFTVASKGPQVLISGYQGTSATNPPSILYGAAYDWEDGSITNPAAFTWRSDLVGALGSGPWVNLSAMPTGLHKITLTVSDSDNNAAMDQVSITIPARTLSVVDTNPPILLSAGSLDGQRIELSFSEMLVPTSAEDTANYVLDGGLNEVVAAVLTADRKTVILSPAFALSEQSFTVTAANIEDMSGNVGGGTVVGGVSLFRSSSIGAFIAPTEALNSSNGLVRATAAGTGLAGSTDNFHFVYRALTGDFDVRVKAELPDDQPALPFPAPVAGLVARETTNSNSRSVAALASLASGGAPFAAIRAITGGDTQYFPNTPVLDFGPHWLRLTRRFNTLCAYSGSNGLDWVVLADVDLSAGGQGIIPPTLLVGFAATSLNSNLVATVDFHDYDFQQSVSPCVELSCPPTNILAVCTNSAGSVVTYTVTATNVCDGNPLIPICNPPSGSVFGAGLTQVHCEVVGSGQTNVCNFTVQVMPVLPLHIMPLGGDSFRIFWRRACQDVIVQQTHSLGPLSQWQTIPQTIQSLGDEDFVVVQSNFGSGTTFFRLRTVDAAAR